MKGIRIDLSHEYLRAAQTYRLSYPQLKQLSRNSLEYSFLPGDSLWRNLSAGKVLAVCRNTPALSGLVIAALRHAALGSSRKSPAPVATGSCIRQF